MFFRIPNQNFYPYFSFYHKINNSADKLRVLSIKYADINGDGLLETLILTGKKMFKDSTYFEDITLSIKNKAGMNIKVKPKNNGGYEPQLFIGKFGKEKVSQVLLSIYSGGSGGFYFSYIYYFKNNVPRLIFDYSKFSDENMYNAIFEDNYKVRVSSLNGELKGIIDLKAIRNKEYLDNLYEINGKLKKTQTAEVLGLTGTAPLCLNGNPIYKLLTYQRIIGLYNVDTLGTVESILELKDGKFNALFTRLVVNV